MHVRMKETKKGCPDGIEVRDYLAGEAYDLPDSLGAVFVREGWGEVCEVGPTEKKPEKGPEETKVDGPKEKKRGKAKTSDKSILDEGPKGL